MNKTLDKNWAVIILGGDFVSPQYDLSQVSLVIAVDHGADYAYKMGLKPDLLIGDLDSVNSSVLEYYRSEGVSIETYEMAKDFTDGEMAYVEVKKRGLGCLLVLAALGGRQDHHLCNIFTAARFINDFAEIVLLGQDYKMMLSAYEYYLDVSDGKYISLLPLSQQVEGVITENLVYPLCDETLFFGSGRGLSNIMSEQEAHVRYKNGELLLIQSKIV